MSCPGQSTKDTCRTSFMATPSLVVYVSGCPDPWASYRQGLCEERRAGGCRAPARQRRARARHARLQALVDLGVGVAQLDGDVSHQLVLEAHGLLHALGDVRLVQQACEWLRRNV